MWYSILPGAAVLRFRIECMLVRAVTVVMIVTSVGCRSDATSPTVSPIARLYRQVTLNHHAITMALNPPNNQLQLTVTPRTASGASLAVSGSVVYTSSDTSVQVDSTGLLTAIASAQGVHVVAAMTIGGADGVTLTDSATINVNVSSAGQVFTTLTIVPQPDDSARVNADGFDEDGTPSTIGVAVLDTQGDSILNTVVILESRNLSIIGGINRYGIVIEGVGHTWIYAEATVYGVLLKDSLLYTVTPAKHSTVFVGPRTLPGSTTPVGEFHPFDDTVPAGGSVMWINLLPGREIDIVFDSPPGAVTPPDSAFYANLQGIFLPSESGGNIPSFASCDSVCVKQANFGVFYGDTTGYRARTFPTPGTYPYHSALYHTTGIIHVVP